MMISNHFISLDHIIDFVKVSKTTAVKELKNANGYIQNYGLSIEYNRNDGYLLIGNEIRIRKLLSDLLVLWNNR